ncbi:MAG TPA: acetoacetyl-CoA synthase [Candidatus Riflebacteria bacterium]|nr:acetoacetyl-CoA synthase [Candidatus Riflebacteria bacterium]
MQVIIFDQKAPKKPTNLSINSDLLMLAKKSRINLSRALENCLAELLLAEKRHTWREENKEAIDQYNSHVATGVFSDGLRNF